MEGHLPMAIQRAARSLAVLAAATCLASAGAADGPIVVADFEGQPVKDISGGNARLTRMQGDGLAAVGEACLRMRMIRAPGRMYVQLALPAGVDVPACRCLSACLRAAPAEAPAVLRWYALDAAGRAIFQRRFTLDSAGLWQRFDWPLALWRWGNDRTGRWAEAKAVALIVERHAAEVWIDHVCLHRGPHPAAACYTAPWLLAVAFAERERRFAAADGLLVATDAADKLAEKDLRAILGRMERARDWVRRVFGKAVRPVDAAPPVSLLIFRDQKGYLDFYRRLGTAWRAEIAAPRGAGYTIQDIAGSTWSGEYGADRPVYLHESAQAILARFVRLRAGVQAHSWLQEGVANYLQLCLYPRSLDRSAYVKNFADGAAPDGSTFFKPLKTLLAGHARMSSYAQLASLVAFLAEKRPDWLGQIAAGLADGMPIDKVLAKCGTDFAGLQKEWLAWGRKAFAPDAAPPAGPGTHFSVPQEWRRREDPPDVEVRKIWDKAPHNAFTDLVRFRDRWVCAFREGAGHSSLDGKIRIIASPDGRTWESAALLPSPSDLPDMRDAKLSVTPKGELMALAAAARRPAGPGPEPARHQTYAWFSPDGKAWGAPAAVGDPDVWLWRVTWHKGVAYGIGYSTTGESFIRLYRSPDGRKFTPVVNRLFEEGGPNETSLVFLPDGTCRCLLRRDGRPNSALLGAAAPPYARWTWKDLGVRVGGPHMIRLPDGRCLAAVRLYDRRVRTSLAWVDADEGRLREFLKLPSGGDTGYAGLVFHEGLLWVSYYASHEGKSCIYLAKVKLPSPTAGPGQR